MEDSKFLLDLGARIKSIRTGQHLTQYGLATSCEFEAASMSRIEAGKINVTVLTLRKISRALNVEIRDFFN